MNIFDIVNALLVTAVVGIHLWMPIRSYPSDYQSLLSKIAFTGLTMWYLFIGMYESTAALYNIGKKIIIAICQFL